MLKHSLMCALLLATPSIIKPHDSEIVVGEITQRDVKNFIAGLYLGAVHGAVNRTIRATHPYPSKANDDYWLYWLVTFAGATALRNEAIPNSSAAQWGHGIGQCIIESIQNNHRGMILNFTMLLAMITSLLQNPHRQF